jgi:hypothetical protein
MRDQIESLIPIFLDIEGERLCLFGSGVLIEFRQEVFILTAGHVIDGFKKGDLLIPALDKKIVSIQGVYAYIKPEGSRNEDFLDYGYFKLDQQFASELKKQFYAIPEREFGIKENYAKEEKMSFGGFPARRSNVAGSEASANEYIYGAYHANSKDYKSLKYHPDANIVAKFNRKKTINPHSLKVQTAPLPHGISGGGIFVWPEVIKELIPSKRKIIGLGHTYKEKSGYFIGTRLEVILRAILHNNPGLHEPT